MKKILILASNPRSDLRIDREIRDLKKAIKRNQNSEQFEVEIELAVRPDELQELFHDNKPYLVHFCGHGTGEQGLVFENDTEGEQLVSNQALSRLFKIFKDDIECVLLNACHTEVQANLIVEHIPYVIGTSREILDKAAYWFTVGFYKALIREQSIKTCYEWGCNAAQLNMPNVNIVSHISERFRKIEVIEENGSQVVTEPLKIVLKQKSFLEEESEETQVLSDMPSDFREEVFNEAEIQQYKNTTRKTWDEFGQSNLVKRESITQNEYRQRKTLLNKVKQFWIEGFLKPSLYANTAINLDWKNSPDAVLRPSEGMEEIPVELDESFEELQTTDILSQMGQGKTLLILGEPGSGKTITLLQLAQKLVNQTEQDLTKPIPVVFNLSSWGQKQQPIEKWLIEEFKDKYQVPLTWSEPWLEQEQLILLLDGLDEVRAEQRNACVRALNQFIATHNLTEIVVCSRVKDYEALSERLQLSSAICIKPLSEKQVYSFLAKAGDSLAGLKRLLQRDRELEQFAQTPLILNIMSLAYQGWSVEDLLQQFRTTKDRYRHLFDSYLERMLQRREAYSKYPKDKVIQWLSWLASRMVQEKQTIFLIEKMQPSWLQTKTKKRLYQFGISLIGAMLIVLILWPIYAWDPLYGIGSRIVVMKGGLINALRWGIVLGLIFGWGEAEIKTVETLTWPWNKTRRDLLGGIISGLKWGLIFSLPLGSIYGIWIFSRWEVYEFFEGAMSGLTWGIEYGLKWGLSLGLTLGLINALKGSEIERKTIPNQGIRKSATNAVVTGLISWLILVPVYWFNSNLISNIYSGLIRGFFFLGVPIRVTTPIDLITPGLRWGLMLGLIFGGGLACIRHLTLRLILNRNNYIAWNYARFLDYASERLLMKKVGGGYIFYHRILMEHFAQRNQVS